MYTRSIIRYFLLGVVLMETLTDASGINTLSLGARVAFALQFTLILFFIISPVMGYFLAREIHKRVNLVLAWGTGTLVMLGGSFALAYVLRGAIPLERLDNTVLSLLSGVAAVCAGMLLARFLSWWLRDPELPQWAKELQNLPPEEMSPIDYRRKAWLERKKRLRGE
jgi:hypothetical protein